MNSRTEVMPPEAASVAPAIGSSDFSQAPFIAAVAMIGWSTALGWAAIRLAQWMFF
jgi:hypothetical protein